jgi:uroporphyrinogen III methyltransferase/synthase
VLLPQAALARDVLVDGLRAKGWTIDVVEAYRTTPVVPSEHVLAAARSADAVTFTSSSTVRHFAAVAGTDHVPAVVACIGPVTAETAVSVGLRVDVVAETSTVEGLIDALVAVLGR